MSFEAGWFFTSKHVTSVSQTFPQIYFSSLQNNPWEKSTDLIMALEIAIVFTCD